MAAYDIKSSEHYQHTQCVEYCTICMVQYPDGRQISINRGFDLRFLNDANYIGLHPKLRLIQILKWQIHLILFLT